MGKKPDKIKTVCSRGHTFYKSKETPVCPICWPGRYKDKMEKVIDSGK